MSPSVRDPCPSLDQRAVDREVFVQQERRHFAVRKDRRQHLAGDIRRKQPVAVLREHRRHSARCSGFRADICPLDRFPHALHPTPVIDAKALQTNETSGYPASVPSVAVSCRRHAAGVIAPKTGYGSGWRAAAARAQAQAQARARARSTDDPQSNKARQSRHRGWQAPR